MIHFIYLLACYLFGAIPIGILVSKVHGLDIRSHGSGNIGATNVARTLGKQAGLIVLIGDILKGIIPILIAPLITETSLQGWCLLATVAGHCFSLNYKVFQTFSWTQQLKGGKGVATSLGGLMILDHRLALFAIGIFIIVFALTHIVSAASIVAAATTPAYGAFTDIDQEQLFPLALSCFIVIMRHRENIERLVRGEEKEFKLGD